MEAPAINSQQWWNDYFTHQWDSNNGPAQTRYFMQLLIDHLPSAERQFLTVNALSVLDWGCAFGQGVEVLRAAFPHCAVAGLDYAERAISQAQEQYPDAEFLHTGDGRIPRPFDVVVTSNCLEHFDEPLELVREQLGQTRQLYILLVPHNEVQRAEYHRVTLTDDSFPARLNGFRKLHSAIIPADARFWSGEQLLVVYGSAEYCARRAGKRDHADERAKWEAHYRDFAAETAETPAVEAFNAEFAQVVAELLPAGGAVLEAGCGAGSQSVALARTGRYDVHLMDFARNALSAAKRRFKAAQLTGSFHVGDVYARGEPIADLVFNAGVLEHYTLDEQAAFVRGMASRSRRFVMVLVPNRQCYWYWLWRVQEVGKGQWPYGKEVPLSNLAEVFRRAGLNFVGQAFLATSWTQEFVSNLDGASPELKRLIALVHEQALLPAAQRAYLVAGLGVLPDTDAPALPRWTQGDASGSQALDELSAALADALATRIGAEQDARRLLDRLDADQKRRDQEAAASAARAQAADRELALIRSRLAEQTEAADAARYQLAEQRKEHAALIALRQREYNDFLRQIEQQSAAIRELETVSETLRSALGTARAERDHLAAQHEALQNELVALRPHAARAGELEGALHEIHSSRAWRLMLKLRRLRVVLAPNDTLRHRLFRGSWKLAGVVFRGIKAGFALPGRLWRALGLPTRMSWYAYAFRRFKRARALPDPLMLTRVRCPGETGLVSVVLPVYNGADFVAESIESVLAQDYERFELIIVDDGSTDATPEIVDRFAAQDPRIRVIHQPNQKLPRALNNGFRAARGELLTWTSADNRLKPDCLSLMANDMERRPAVDMIYANLDIIGEDGAPLQNSAWYAHYQRPPGSSEIHLPADTAELNVWPNNYIGAAFMYRVRTPYLVGEYGIGRFCVEDYDYWMRVNAELTLRHSAFRKSVYDYRFHGKSLTAAADELGITPAVRRLMVFEEFRRNFYVSPMVWRLDGPSHGPRGALRDRLAGALASAGQCVLGDGALGGAERLPRLWMPVAQVEIVDTPDAALSPPRPGLPGALRVLVATRGGELPAEIADGWDLCICTDDSATPTRLDGWRGWLVIADEAALVRAIDIRAKQEHLHAIEREIERPAEPTCAATVVICSYRRVDLLERALRAVAPQRVADATYEVLVVNNDVADARVPRLIARLRDELFADRPEQLRLVDCPLPGLSHARNVGIAEARGELICFLDDDALPQDGWLAALIDAFRRDPEAGVIGGKILLRPPADAPEWLRPDWQCYWSHLDLAGDDYRRTDAWWEFPWGANWAARRETLLRIGGFRTHYGRKADDFGGGEELAAAMTARALGYKIGLAPRSAVIHDVDAQRYTLEHVHKTIHSAVMVNYRLQNDLHLPREVTFRRTVWLALRHGLSAASWRRDRYERFRQRAYAGAYWRCARMQLRDAFARLRRAR